MAHTQTPGWRWPDADSREVWERRRIFLEAATAAEPSMVRELQELMPLALRAVDAMRDLAWTRPHITWRHIDDQVGIMRRRGRTRDFSPFLDGITDPDRRRNVYRLHRALPAWAERWSLLTPTGKFIGEWVLEAALSSLVRGDEPLVLRQPEMRFVGPIHVTIPAFEAEPWSGDESVSSWRSRQIATFTEHLNTHVAPALEQLSNSDEIEPVPKQRSETRRYLQLAARWQVLGEEWGEFLTREGLLEKKVDNVRAKILGALHLIGIVPRLGMRTA
jgi:hypothetical protein